MTYRPGDPTRTHQLLAALAQAPDPQLTTDWAGELRELTAAIHTAVHEQAHDGDGIDGPEQAPWPTSRSTTGAASSTACSLRPNTTTPCSGHKPEHQAPG